MPRNRPARDPISFHKHTGQYYVTRGGKRVYLGSDHDEAMAGYHRLALGVGQLKQVSAIGNPAITAKELANRFIAAQQANWREMEGTKKDYRDWLGRFLKNHRGLKAAELTVEMFAAWKLSMRKKKYAAETINHSLNAVRAMYTFAEDSGLLEAVPRLKRVKNEPRKTGEAARKRLYTAKQISKLLSNADSQMRLMILLGLNCGFGSKDIHDVTWDDFKGDRVTLPRSKTGVCQTFVMWPETSKAYQKLRWERSQFIERMARRDRERDDNGHVFMTKFWHPWCKDALALQFRRLCKKAKVPCHGFYRFRHCASTAILLVANPHVQRRFMRHSQLQQQVAYTHIPDAEVDAAISRVKSQLLDGSIEASGNDPQQEGVA